MKLLMLLAALVALASAERVFLERNGDAIPLPRDWVLTRRRPDLTQTRDLSFALKIGNSAELDRQFHAVSQPDSPDYGKYLTIHQLAEITKNPEGVVAVRRFLRRFGVTNTRVALTQDWVDAKMPLVLIEKVFNVTFHTFHHLPSGQFHVATLDDYSLPAQVAQFVDMVTPITGFPDVHTPRTVSSAGASRAGDSITPSVIRARYNVSESITCNNMNNSHGVAEFQNQNYKPSDLVDFFNKYVPNAPAGSDVIAKVIGSNEASPISLEASLDTQYLMGVAPNVTTWFYGYASFDFYGDLNKWISDMNSEEQIPFVITVSYGSQGDYPSNTYISRQDEEYEKLGLRGTSIIYASGDSGAECNDRCKKLDLSYPAESIYVTATGATRFLTGNTGPEGAVEAFKSGGGFSQTIPVPTYQSTVVRTYVNDPSISFPPPLAWNSSNRANPDFAALGAEEFEVIRDGRTEKVGGTSASAPTFGAVMTYLNDLRLNAGKPTLGFLNPQLYQWARTVPNSFFDVTVGNNYEVSRDCEAKLEI